MRILYARLAHSAYRPYERRFGDRIMKPAAYSPGLTLLWPPIFTSRVCVPLYAEPCAAGFPSPAAD